MSTVNKLLGIRLVWLRCSGAIMGLAIMGCAPKQPEITREVPPAQLQAANETQVVLWLKDGELFPWCDARMVKRLSNPGQYADPGFHARWIAAGRELPGIVEVLENLVRHNDPRVRRATAIHALGELGDPSSMDVLLPLLRDKEGIVRVDALRALTSLGNQRAVGAIIATMGNSPNPFTRRTVVMALEKLGGDLARGHLGEVAVTDSDGDVRDAARRALGRMGAAEDDK